jgi:molybdenum cofactor guanylyltransferase/molybdopterin-guanine dinucleotide biosynthesis protein MobB
MTSDGRIASVVLAGGQGARFGGRDKAGIMLAGRPLLQHVVERILPAVPALAVNLRASAALPFYGLGLPILKDGLVGQPGPLAGVLAGLRWAEHGHPQARWLLTVPTDTPFLPTDLVPRLFAAAQALPNALVMAASDTGLHPTVALWPVAGTADTLEAWLIAGGRKMTAAPAALGRMAIAVHFAQSGGDPFANINTPADLADAERRLAGRTASPAVIGIAGWKNSGKTALTVALIAEFTRRGLSVATVKHAHHGFDIDQPGTDSARHRAAGAREVAIVSSRRMAHIRELGDAPEPSLADILRGLGPVDLVLVEGFKRAAMAKLEVRRAVAPGEPLYPADPHIFAIASDHPVVATVPVLPLDAIGAIADLIAQRFDLA